MDKKQFGYIFLVFFGILTYYLWANNDSIAQIIANNGLQGIFWYFISNANYVLILVSIFILNREVGFMRNLGGGILVIYAFDIVSFPRLNSAGMTQDIGLLASSDALVMNKLLAFGIQYNTAYTFYYLILPIVLLLIAVSILGVNNLLNKVLGVRHG